MIVPWD